MSSENSNNPASKKHGPNNTIEFMIRAINDSDVDKFYSLASAYLNELSNKSHYGTRINNALLDRRKKNKKESISTQLKTFVELRKCRALDPLGYQSYYFHTWLIKKDDKGNELAVALLENMFNGIIVKRDAEYIVFDK